VEENETVRKIKGGGEEDKEKEGRKKKRKFKKSGERKESGIRES
jgi:hypothetical protein